MVSERKTIGDATRNQWRRNAKSPVCKRRTTDGRIEVRRSSIHDTAASDDTGGRLRCQKW